MAKVIHCILNNLFYDQRVHKLATTLAQTHEVEIVGVRTKRNEVQLSPRAYKTHRVWVPMRRGVAFFGIANLQIFFYLLLRRWDAVVACDLDILPACWLAARLRRRKILLDSRELYTQTSFQLGKPIKRRIWQFLERTLYPSTPYILTVSPPIAHYFERKYRRPVWVIYNLPLRGRGFARPRLENRLLLYQGMLHPHRGLEELILALMYAPEWKLWILGDGPQRNYLEALVQQQRLQERIRFFGLVPFEAVAGYTKKATLGVSGEVPRSLNHRYALPNKVFDYLQQGIPVLVGEAPLVQALVHHYGCGYAVKSWQPKEIAYALEQIGASLGEYEQKVQAARAAAKELHWERQEPCIRTWLQLALEGKPLPPQRTLEPCASVAALEQIYERAS